MKERGGVETEQRTKKGGGQGTGRRDALLSASVVVSLPIAHLDVRSTKKRSRDGWLQGKSPARGG